MYRQYSTRLARRCIAMRCLIAYFFTVFLAIYDVRAARILGLFPHTGRSHQMVFEPLLQNLAERGHHLTVVSFFPLKNPPANYTDSSLEGISPPGLESIDLMMFENSNRLLRLLGVERIIIQMFAFWPLDEFALNVCKKLVDWPILRGALTQQYDVVIVEYFNSDCMLGLMHVYGVRAPIVAISSSGLMPWTPNRIGLSDNPSYVPLVSMPFTSKMSFTERLENTFLRSFYKYWFRNNIQLKEKEVLEKHFGRKMPDLEDLAKNVSLIIVNTHHTLNGVRPLLPGLVEVGGMHIDHTRKPIPHVST